MNQLLRASRLRFSLLILILLAPQVSPAQQECVVLLHGLARTSNSLNKIESALIEAGFLVSNIDYPSTEAKVAQLSVDAVGAGINNCDSMAAEQIHFVTHSLGGILVRYYFANNKHQKLGRVVMLAPPNQGSEVVDSWKKLPGYSLLNGPAGDQLGTDEHSVPLSLGPVDFDLGVIAGNRSVNPFLSQFLPNPDDGKVSVASTKVEGMRDHLVLPVTHTLMMRNDQLINQVIYYLQHGSFNRTGK